MKSFVLIPARTMLFVCLVLVATGHATIRNVPSTYPTIQAGVDAAQDGDTVLLAPGGYKGTGNWTVDIIGKSIVITTSAGSAYIGGYYTDSTSVRGSGFRITDTPASTTLIENLKFQMVGSSVYDDTGAIVLTNAAATIRDCEFLAVRDAVVCLGDSYALVDSCLMQSTRRGAMIGDSSLSTPSAVLTDCNIITNAYEGIVIRNAGNVTIDHCLIYANNASGILIGNSDDVTISHSTIGYNQIDGIRMESFPPALTDKAQGVVQVSETVVFTNVGAGISDITSDHNTQILCTLAWGNDSGNFVNVTASDGDANGNITADPEFTYPHEWWGLSPKLESPCAPENNSCSTLIGLMPVDSSTSCCSGSTGDVNGDNNQTLTDLTQLVLHLFVSFQPVNCRAAANTNGDEDCVINLTDLTILTNHLFTTFQPTALCTDFDPAACDL